ncbi:MAG TPA: hypothetical protein PLS69_03980, partial [Terricaulis sp.]|nr:hypothetical protein [Terricaulis sp.]
EARNQGAEAPEPASLAGRYKPASETALNAGAIDVQRAGLSFANGAALFTRTLEPRRAVDLTARDGQSYAALIAGAGDLEVELRRVIDSTAPDRICAERPTYAALIYGERATGFTLLVFSGAEAPGPNASDTALCASYRYSALHGARTQVGVVLW